MDDLVLGGAGCSCFFVGHLAGKDVRDIAALPVGSAFPEEPGRPPTVAALETLADGRRLLILGGDGESSAGDASPCVAAVVSGADEWSTVQLDPENACSAVVGYDGGWLVQCGHRLRLVRLA